MFSAFNLDCLAPQLIWTALVVNQAQEWLDMIETLRHSRSGGLPSSHSGGGDLWLLSTPWGKRGFFYEM